MLGWFAQTSMIAAGLAALAALMGRSRRLGPEARHAFWLAVLIKFAMPPLVAWPWLLPEAWPAPAPVAVPEASTPARSVEPLGPTPTQPEVPPVVEPPTVAELPPDPGPSIDEPTAPPAPPAGSEVAATPEARPEAPEAEPSPTGPAPISTSLASEIRDRGAAVLLGLWLAGSAVVVTRRGLALVRFRRSLKGAGPAPDWLPEEARAIGDRLGVRPPPILVVEGVATPLLWCLGRPRLILPAHLIGRLDADRWPGIVAHELAHLARRDHWVVRLELLVEAVWWWNPLFHLARRRLREEAELAADARVIRALPDRRFAYAEALVDVCEHLTRSAIPSPALGVGGAGASRSLEARLLMILRDPIPRRPGRRAALLAGLLVALSVPTWTLGQQPEPTPKPGLPEAAPKPVPAPPESSPKLDPDLTIEKIRAGFAKRLERPENLGFRYSLASRIKQPMSGGEGVVVLAADVVLGPKEKSRLDLLSSPVSRLVAAPPDVVPWQRQFVARDESSLASFRALWSQKGPVPFRWLSAGGRAVTLGDNLAAELLNGVPSEAVDKDRSIDPLDPRPANVLDLAGASAILLGPGYNLVHQEEVAGAETVDGREVVRIAWFAYRNDGNGGGGLRGLLWVAPTLGFAVVRSEASQDPSQVAMTHGRRAWRKSSTDFVEVGGLWLPRKVEARFAEANPDGTPSRSQELVATIEDYRANPDLPPDTFHPRFKIEALDEPTGQFTTLPPETPPGLVDRLKRAVAESPFGPPHFAEPAATPVAARPGINNRDSSQVAGPNARPTDARPATTPPDLAARPTPRANPTPAPDPGKADPSAVDVRPVGPQLKADIDRRLQAELQVVELARQMVEAKSKIDELQRITRTEGDPAIRKAKEKLEALQARYNELLEGKSSAIREQTAGSTPRAREDVERADFRRNRKLAEVAGAEARRDLARAVVDRNTSLQVRNPAHVSKEEVARAESELKIAEAELAGKKAELDQSDPPRTRRDAVAAELARARARRDLAATVTLRNSRHNARDPNFVSQEEVTRGEAELRIAEAELAGKKAELDEAELLLLDRARSAPAPARDSLPVATPLYGGTLADLRDAVELMEVQLEGKKDALRGPEAKLQSARELFEARKALAEQGRITQAAMIETEAALNAARAEVDQKKSEVLEFEVRLKQARRRAEAEEARLRREAERAKAELDRVEALHKQRIIGEGSTRAARDRYDDLMFQLDPKHEPAKAPTTAPESPR